MVSPGEPDSQDPGGGSFEEALAYLLVFSEALLDIVPDPIGVLDDRLRVRNANGALAHALGFGSIDALRGASLADHALLRAGLPDEPGSTLADALRRLCAGGDETLSIERLEVAEPEGKAASWTVRALGWDTEDPSYRRVLLWARRRETVELPAPPTAAEPAPFAETLPVPPPPVVDLPIAEPPSAEPPSAEPLSAEPLSAEPPAAEPPPAEPPPAEPPAAEPPPEEPSASPGDRRAETPLEELGVAACVVDRALHVRSANARLRSLFGRPDAGEDLDRPHLFTMLPELRDTELPALVDAFRSGGGPAVGTVSVRTADGRPLRLEIEIQPTAREDDEAKELLLLFHEVEGMPTTETQTPVPETPKAILEPDRLTRWPTPTTDRVLLVEADSWTRMAFADALRRAGLDDLASCDSGAEAWARHDPAFFALAIVGFDSAPEDAAEFCARMARDAARVPVLAITEASIEKARAGLAAFPLAGILSASPQSQDFIDVAVPLARRGLAGRRLATPVPAAMPGSVPPAIPPAMPAAAPPDAVASVPPAAPETSPPMTPAVPAASAPAPTLADVPPATPPALPEPAVPPAPVAQSAPPTPTAVAPPEAGRAVGVVLLGAREADVAAMQLLHRTKGVRVRLVYESDADALGLAVAQSLGIPAISGGATVILDPPPDVVVMARRGLEGVLEGLHLERVPCIDRDEIELFAADPEAFLRTEPAKPAPVAAPEASGPPAPAAPPATSPPLDAPAHREEAVPPPSLAAPPSLDSIRPDTLGPEPRPEPARPPTFSSPQAAARRARFEEPPREFAPRDATVHAAEASGPGAEDVSDFVALSGAFDLLFDFDRLCRRVLDLAMSSVHGVSGSLMLLAEDGRTLQIVAAVGLSDLVVRETRQRVGEGIAGRVADDAEPLLLVGTIGDERFPVRGERPEIPSAVCVPIMAEGRVLGVLNVNSEPTNEPFDHPELRRLATWARQVGPALDRSRQLQQVRGRSFELSVRGAIESIASSSEDLVTRLRRVATRATELLNVDWCAIWLHEPKTERLVLRALSGGTASSMDALSVPVGTGLVGWVARYRRPLVLRHSPDDPGDVEALRVASVAVPIRHHTDLVGVLAVEATAGSPMDAGRIALVSTVAAVVGEQVGASRAQASSEHMVTMLSALSELGVAFGAARERRGLGRLVAFTAATVLESDVATVRILRDDVPPGAADLELFELLAAHGASPGGPDDPLSELEERVAREVLGRRAGVTDTDLPAREAESLLTRSNVKSLLAIPMLSDDDELLGVVVVYRVADARGRDSSYGDPEREIAARLGDYAAAAAQRFSAHGGSPEIE